MRKGRATTKGAGVMKMTMMMMMMISFKENFTQFSEDGIPVVSREMTREK